jgi:hypothetical protein
MFQSIADLRKDIMNGQVAVPEDLDNLYVLESLVIDEKAFNTYDDEIKFAMLYISINKMKSNEAWKILRALGDVNFIEQFSNCFSKQDYANVLANVKEAIFTNDARYSKGINFALVPKDDAFTVIDLVDLLSKDSNSLMIDEAFNYSRIGAGSKVQSKEEKLNELKDAMAKATDTDEIKEIAEEITSVRDSVKFVPFSLADGVDINSIVYNESRPNISVSTTLNGYVELDDEVVSKFGLPKSFKTSITRSYTIVKDGIKNLTVIPVRLTINTFAKLQSNGILTDETYFADKTYYIDLTKIPIINRNMVSEVNGAEYFKECFELEKLKALQKVYKYKLDAMKTGTSASFVALYGDAGAQYLEDFGIRTYGFSPKVKTDKIGDSYYAKELSIKISGLSSLPTINATLKKQTEGKKINLADQLILDALKLCESEIEAFNLLNPDDKEAEKAFLETRTKEIITSVRAVQFKMNRAMYAIVVGQVWFKGFENPDETSMDFNYNGIGYTVKAVLEEKEIKI